MGLLAGEDAVKGLVRFGRVCSRASAARVRETMASSIVFERPVS